jgi:hypothetical protein
MRNRGIYWADLDVLGLGRAEPGRRPACKKGMPFPFVLNGTYALWRFGLGKVYISM